MAYADNASIIEGATIGRFYPDADRIYSLQGRADDILTKVETHNHPTAISPFPGASTGSGGEIRDEGATGKRRQAQGRPLRLLGLQPAHARAPQPWEKAYGKPVAHRFGPRDHARRPDRCGSVQQRIRPPEPAGYFRTYEQDVAGTVRGYHKPIMIAGGLGNIQAGTSFKERNLPGRHLLVVLGGPVC
jgi:phosphoribosylformylglycinamidine synthase